MSVITLGRQTFKPLPWRTIGLLAVLALLLAGVAVYVGGQPRPLPAPFGLAANGLVAYAQNGDIFTVDPATGARQAIVSGPEGDREPRFSLDGTRLAFLRTSGDLGSLVIVDVRSRDILATTDLLIDPDSDSVAWSPDGRSILVASGPTGSRQLNVVDAATGSLTKLPIEFLGEASWRPPDGRQILYIAGIEADKVMSIVNLADNAVTPVVGPGKPDGVLRQSGWTPDGQRIVFMRGDGAGSVDTHVRDLTTGSDVTFLDTAFAHVSNDGTRMVALDDVGRMCVADLDGGRCKVIATAPKSYEGSHAAGAQWSPDDAWLIVRLASGNTAILVDPDTGETLVHDQSPWTAEGAESWQRKAP